MCVRICCAIHALWGIAYTAAGSIQLVAGIFFLLSLPILRMGSNICTGACNVLIGVGTVMLSCFGDLNERRCQRLLTLTFLALGVNVINLVLLEVGEWFYFLTPETKELISQHNHEELVFYARVSTSLTTALVIIIAFVDSQLTYCSMQFKKDPRMRGGHLNETVSDIEYILPRHKPRTSSSKQSHILNQYTQSWVFDADPGTSSQNESPYLKLSPSAPMETISEKSSRRHYQASPLAHTPVVRVQVTSEDTSSTTLPGRRLNHMSSFSRTPSPGAVSSSSGTVRNQPPIYDCLEKLTKPNLYRSRLDMYLTEDVTRPSSSRSDYSRLIPSEHASLIIELEKSFTNKKTSTEEEEELEKQRTSDAEFSKELEAALKLIQDLESPNTIETPSDSCKTIPGTNIFYKVKDDDGSRTGSSRTLSGNEQASDNGKKNLEIESQSSSGYNSPSPEKLSENVTPTRCDVPCTIRYSGETAVISIGASAPSDNLQLNKIETCVSVGKNNNVEIKKINKNKFWKFWDVKKQTPMILPEVANAVVKSESLAFLTDKELEARLDQSKNLRRQIEEKIVQEKSIRNLDLNNEVLELTS